MKLLLNVIKNILAFRSRYLLGDSRKAIKELNWKPKFNINDLLENG